MNCFYHKSTGEVESYPVNLHDEKPWQETIDKAEEHFDEYISFEPMESYESFKLMKDFINEIPINKIREKFEHVIQRKKPFQQFKYLLQDYPTCGNNGLPGNCSST